MIAIVGGGVMGSTLLYLLAARGLPVTLFEGGKLGERGASGVPVALLNPYRGRSARASPFDLESLETMWQLVDELAASGYETGVYRTGVLRVASNAKQAKAWRKRAEGAGVTGNETLANETLANKVRWLEPDEVDTGYHAPFGAFVALQGGWLEPHVWLQVLVQAAQQRGGTALEGHEVTRLKPGMHGTTLHTTAGSFSAAQVVLCSGTGLTLGQGALGLGHVAGEVIGLELGAPPPVLPYPLAGAVYGAARGRTFYLGGNHRPAAQTDDTAPAQLQRAGGWFIPALQSAQLGSVWHGVRAKTPDHQPIVRQLGPGLWFAGALAGRGFLGAAQVARTVIAALTEA